MTNNILFATRNLQLTYVEAGCHSPCMLSKDDWWWLVNLDFGSWVYRAISKSKEAGVLDQKTMEHYEIVRKYLRETYGDECNTIRARAKNPIVLSPIPAEFFSLNFCALMGLHDSPPWPTFDADKERFAPRDEPDRPDVATMANAKSPTTTSPAASVIAATTQTKTDEKTIKKNVGSKPRLFV